MRPHVSRKGTLCLRLEADIAYGEAERQKISSAYVFESLDHERCVALELTLWSANEFLTVEVAVAHAADAIDYELRHVRQGLGFLRRPFHIREQASGWIAY